MLEKTGRPVEIEPPLEEGDWEVVPPERVAAGIPAVLSTLKHLAEEPGLLRGIGTMARVNQARGVDCTSCAWPDPEHRSIVEFCENGAKAIADETTTKRVTPDFFAAHSVTDLSRRSDLWLGKQGRLTHPMYLPADSDRYEPIGWDAAFALIAEHLNRLPSPDQAVFYTSGRTSNEAAFLYQLFVRLYGTNNLPDCSNMCHESSGRALDETIGIGKGTVKLEDFYHADAIFIVGQNPGTNHPRMLSALERACQNGARLVSINPLPEAGLVRFKNPQDFLNPIKAVKTLTGEGTQMAELHLPVRINGDVALFKGLLKDMAEREAEQPGAVFDSAFIADKTEGFEAFLADIKAESWDRIVESSGISRDLIRRAADIAVSARRIIVCWAMGLTQHKNAVGNIQEIVNFLLVKGSIGRRGAGVCPVRGHSNVQGDRTMGIWERPTKKFLDSLAAEFDFEPPRKHGLDTVRAIKAMHEGRARVFIALGGNFLSASPDTAFTAAALQKCDLTVQISTKLNRSHLVTGTEALILPCLGRTERDLQTDGPQFVSVENSMGLVHRSEGTLEPASDQLLSEPAIVARLARATLGDKYAIRWENLAANYDNIRHHIARTIPGFEDYNARIRQPGWFYLPNGPREARFPTPSGKARFTVHPIPEENLQPGQLVMMTIRSHDQFNTTIYGNDDRYRGITNRRRVILMNPQDVVSRGLRQGELVDITSHFEDGERHVSGFAVVPYPIPAGCAATYFPETNPLVPIDSVAEKSNTPVSKHIVISLQPSR